MKRQEFASGNSIEFYRLPITTSTAAINGLKLISLPEDILNEIQSKLPIVSFIQLGMTCQDLYRFQAPYKVLKEKQVYTQCIERICQNLKENNLLTVAQKLIADFGGVIEGDFVEVLLWKPTTRYILNMTISKRFDLNSVYLYLKQNMPNTENFIHFERGNGGLLDFDCLWVIDSSCSYKLNMSIVQGNSEDIIDDFAKKLPHTAKKNSN